MGKSMRPLPKAPPWTFPADLIHRIDRILDERSEVRDNASPELSKLRKEKAYKLASVEHKIQHDLKVARQAGWTPDDAEITIRNGRLVIPMLSTHKRKISGYVHDESATVQTVYIEPAEISKRITRSGKLNMLKNGKSLKYFWPSPIS